MLSFTARVQVCAPASSNILFQIHGERAQQLIDSGTARPVDRGKKIGKIELVESISRQRRGEPHKPSLSDYAGWRATYRQRLTDAAPVVSLKRIDPRDRPLFRLAVTDCLR